MGFMDIFSSSQEKEINTGPWAAQQPYLKTLFSEADRLRKEGGPQYYPEDTLAPRSPLITQGEDAQLGYAGGDAFRNMMDQSYQSTTGNLGGGYFGYNDIFNDPNVGSAYTQAVSGDPNPYTQEAASAVRQDMFEDYMRPGGQLSQIRDATTQYQPGGSSRTDMMNRISMDEFDENQRNVTAGMYNQNYNAAQDRMLSGLGVADQTRRGMGGEDLNRYATSMGYVPQQYGMTMGGYDAMKGIGQDQMDYSQAQIEDERQRFEYGANLPYENLGWYKGLTSGDYGGTSIGSGVARGRDSAYNIGKGVATDASGAAGVLSALGAFSDRRLKKNIHKIGKLMNGLNVYTFDYLWGESSVGVMADEVRKVKPDAVTNFHGFDVVDYAEIL